MLKTETMDSLSSTSTADTRPCHSVAALRCAMLSSPKATNLLKLKRTDHYRLRRFTGRNPGFARGCLGSVAGSCAALHEQVFLCGLWTLDSRRPEERAVPHDPSPPSTYFRRRRGKRASGPGLPGVHPRRGKIQLLKLQQAGQTEDTTLHER